MKTYLDLSTCGRKANILAGASAAAELRRQGHIIAVKRADGSMVALPLYRGNSRTKDQIRNWEHCRDIAHDVEAVCDGKMYRCPECGEYFRVSDSRPLHLCRCGNLIDMEDDEAEQVSILDWFSDVYNIQYVVDDENNVEGVILMVACGGPNIYVDTFRRVVRLHWWGTKAEYELLPDACVAIEEAFEEVRSC